MTPAVWIALAVAFCLVTSSVRATVMEGTATIGGRAAAGAVVVLDGPAGRPQATSPGRAVMDQKNLAFAPGMLAVPRGTVVEFTNSDDVQHNVFSPSAVAGKFNLGTYGPGAAGTVTLDQLGDVLVLCNIHMEMEAHILVVDGPFAAVGDDGGYRIPDVPAGAYTVKLWRGRWLPFTRTIQVPATGSLAVDVVAGE